MADIAAKMLPLSDYISLLLLALPRYMLMIFQLMLPPCRVEY